MKIIVLLPIKSFSWTYFVLFYWVYWHFKRKLGLQIIDIAFK